MGQADHGHFGGHHRIGGRGDFVQRFQKHLPQAGQHAHRQGLGHLLTAGAFFRGDCRVFGGIRRDLHDRHPVGDLGQIA